MDIPLVLSLIRPDAFWLSASNYEDLQKHWLDETQKIPSMEEIEEAWEKIKGEQQLEIVRQRRAQLYPEFFEMAHAFMHELMFRKANGEAISPEALEYLRKCEEVRETNPFLNH